MSIIDRIKKIIKRKDKPEDADDFQDIIAHNTSRKMEVGNESSNIGRDSSDEIEDIIDIDKDININDILNGLEPSSEESDEPKSASAILDEQGQEQSQNPETDDIGFDFEKALGFAEDGDSDDMAGLPAAFEDTEENDEFNDIFSKKPDTEDVEEIEPNIAKEPKESAIVDGDAKSNLDEQLKGMLDEDEKASANFDMPDESSINFINDRNEADISEDANEIPDELLEQMRAEGMDLFEPIPDEENEEDKSSKVSVFKKLFSAINQKISGVPAIVFYIVIGVLSVGAAGIGVFLVLTYGKINSHKEIELQLQGTAIKQPQLADNKTNYIYTDEANIIDDIIFVMKKIVIDEYETVFYFNKIFDLKKYEFKLFDGDGNSYPLNLFYVLGNPKKGRVHTDVHFMPLPIGTEIIKVTVKSIETGEECEFKLRVDGGVVSVPVCYTVNPVKADTPIRATEIYVENAVFSSDASIINFSIASNSKKTGIAIDPDNPIALTLQEGYSHVLSAMNAPEIYNADGLIIGRMNFGPLQNLTGTVSLKIANLLNNVTLDLTINAQKMFEKRGEERQERIQTDGLDIVLEGMQKQGNYYILVAHGENPELFTDQSNIYANRVEVIFEAELTVFSAEGDKYVLTGRCISGKRGADILFDMGDHKKALTGAPTDKIELTIKSVSFKMDDVIIPININDAADTPDSDVMNAKNSIIEAFEKRLGLKTDKVSSADLNGLFSSDLLSDKELMSNYEPAINANTASSAQPEISVQVQSYVLKNNLIYAVVMESWVYIDGATEVRFYKAHNITAKKSNESYTIIYDEIMN